MFFLHLPSSFIYSGVGSAMKKKPLLQDKPVVFHSRIRSSGYGNSPSLLGGGQKSKSRPAGGGLAAAGAGWARRTTSGTRRSPTPLLKQYPVDCGPLIRHQIANDPLPSSEVCPPLLHVAYGGDAQSLATASMDGTVHLYRLPVAKHKVSKPCIISFTQKGRQIDC